MEKKSIGAVVVASWAALSLGTRWTSMDTLFPVFLGPRMSNPPGVRVISSELLRTLNRPRLGDFSLMALLTLAMGTLAALCIVQIGRLRARGTVVLAVVHLLSNVVALSDVYSEYRGQPAEWGPLFLKIIMGSLPLAAGVVLLVRESSRLRPDTSKS